MKPENERDILAAILFVEAVIVILLLLPSPAPVEAATAQPVPQNLININVPSDQYSPGNTSVGGLTTSPLNLSILFPQQVSAPTSCSCGCNENDPVNTAFGNLQMFVNQLENGLYAAQQASLNAAAAAIPNWMQQYINSGGQTIGYSNGQGGI